MNSSTRRTLRTAAAGTATAALMAVGLGAASAHVHVTPDSTAAGSSSLLTFAISHGCDVSSTTQMTFTLPDELHDATPTAKAGWTVETVTEQLDEPKELETGTEIVERVSKITYTAETPLPDGVRDTFMIGVDLPQTTGEPLAFPVLQTCEAGETDWSQVPKAGEDAHALEAPAPMVQVTAPDAPGGHGGAATPEPSTAASPEAAPTADAQSEGVRAAEPQDNNDLLGWAGLTAGLLGLAAGIAALARTRRKQG